MRVIIATLVPFVISACSTLPNAALLEHRQAVQEKTRPDSKVITCNCPTVNPETGEAVYAEKQFTLAKGQFGAFPIDFNEIAKAQQSVKIAVNEYAEKISSSSSFEEKVSGLHCWTGTCGPTSEYFIYDLKDIRKTWVFLSAFPKTYSHKCTFSDNPDAWITEECPAVPADLNLDQKRLG